jgi:hypothetical protein
MLLAVFLAAELNPFYLKVGVISIYVAHILTDPNDMIHAGFRVCSGWNQIIPS